MIEAFSYALFGFAPAGLLWLCSKVPVAAKVGPIVLCYAAGLVLGLSGLLPEVASAPRVTVSEVSLGLALPLLLFGVDIRAWKQVAGSAMLSMLCAVIAVVTVSSTLFYLFSAQGVERSEQLSGMAVGMYTGGVANLAAIKVALSIPDDRFLYFATVDTVVGAVYLLFVLTIAPKVFSAILPAFDAEKAIQDAPHELPTATPSQELFLPAVIALLCAAACVGLALVIAPQISMIEPQIAIIVLLTSLGLVASLIAPIRRNQAAPHIGMYLIYVFSFCIAASMDLAALRDVDLSILFFVLIATFGGLGLHAWLCRLVKIDRDTFLITSVSALMSPAFVPMVARSLRNPAILMSGMITGILGFALGNYLGITVALILAK